MPSYLSVSTPAMWELQARATTPNFFYVHNLFHGDRIQVLEFVWQAFYQLTYFSSLGLRLSVKGFNESHGHMTLIECNSHLTSVGRAHESSLWEPQVPGTYSGKTPSLQKQKGPRTITVIGGQLNCFWVLWDWEFMKVDHMRKKNFLFINVMHVY